MIRPLRRTHRAAMCGLAILLPVLLAVAVIWRQPRPIQATWPLGAGADSRP